ncbi:MAG: hypothetical protein IJS54_07580 [Desulfovibrio sp.]|nr:hypothetical protein [Desulfovibrio sp.]
MHTLPPICILWDASHIWGLMAWRALHAVGLNCRLTQCREIAQGILDKGGVRLLVVPGGNARQKAQALGGAGMTAIQDFVKQGGGYLGFCGGAGLALHAKETLSLCPWSRKPYPDRLQHLISGHVLANVTDNDFCPSTLKGKTLALPVWWPGQFREEMDPRVHVLAKAKEKAQDFWLGDLPLSSIPERIVSLWHAEYGLDLSSNFLCDKALVVEGLYGKGRYVLSYSHLETPQSPDANNLLAHILTQMTQIPLPQTILPAWILESPSVWESNAFVEPLLKARYVIKTLIALALEHHLFFERTSWLYGWASGIPGAMLNSLHAAIVTLLSIPPSPKALSYFAEVREHFTRILPIFAAAAEESLLTSRITSVLGHVLPHGIRQKDRTNRQEAIFGSPIHGGGLLGSLLGILEEMLYLSQENR